MFYVTNLILLLIFLIELGFLRSGIYAKLRLENHSKGYIRKSGKGFFNYWIYTRINKEHRIGAMYYLNIIYCILVCMFAVTAVFMGFLDFMRLPILCISVAVAVTGVVATVCSSIYCGRADYGKSFVWLAKDKQQPSGKLFSSLLEWLFALVPFFVIWLNFFG